MSLTTLDFTSSTLQTVPDLSNMTNLVDLSISDGAHIDVSSQMERGQVETENRVGCKVNQTGEVGTSSFRFHTANVN